jgi:hypothetical protein
MTRMYVRIINSFVPENSQSSPKEKVKTQISISIAQSQNLSKARPQEKKGGGIYLMHNPEA